MKSQSFPTHQFFRLITQSNAPHSSDTKALLLDHAEKMFAEDGVFAN